MTAFLPAAQAQSWPQKPIKLIVTFAPGGSSDIVARLLQPGLQEKLGQTVIVENKPGADGAIATMAVISAPADGSTLLFGTNTAIVGVPTLRKSPPYDPLRDLAPVSFVGRIGVYLFVRQDLPVQSLSDLLNLARSRPGTISAGSAHSPGRLALAQLEQLTKTSLNHIPYKGSAPAQQDMIGGRVPLLFDVLFSSMPFVKDNRMKVIALSSPKRAASSPEIPLIAETVPGFSAVSAIGIIGPAGMPPALLQKISADIGQVVRSAEVVSRMQQLGMEPVGSTSEQYTAQIRQDIDKWAAIVKSAGIKLD